MRRRLWAPVSMLAVVAIATAGFVALAPRDLDSPPSVAETPAAPGGGAPASTDVGAAGYGAEADAVVPAIDPALAAELSADDAPESIDAVFLVGPESEASKEFREYASAHLEKRADGWYSGGLTPDGVDILGVLPDVRVARNEVLQLDPITSYTEVAPAADTVTTVPKTDPALAAARTATRIQGTGQVIAIVDSGIDTAAPGLGGTKVVTRVDFTAGTACPATTRKDPWGHGTGVSSVAAGSPHTSIPGVEGVAPGARLVDVRIYDCQGLTDWDKIGQALTWIRDHHEQYGITVVNLSFGSAVPDVGLGTDPTSVLVNQLVADGLVVVAAAGNLGDGASTVVSPASARFATAVGAAIVSRHGAVPAPFSSFGPVGTRAGIDLVAPGASLTVAKSTALTWTTDRVTIESGTSLAAPYVAGLAALLRQQNPTLAPSGVICPECAEGVELESMSNPIQDLMVTSDWFEPGVDAISGAGLVSASSSLRRQTLPAASSALVELTPGVPAWVRVPARPASTSISVVTDTPVNVFAGESIGFSWFEALGAQAGLATPCSVAGTSTSKVCMMSPNPSLPRVSNLVVPASQRDVWLRIEAGVARTASISVAGVTGPLDVTADILVSDVDLASGPAVLRIERTVDATSPTDVTVGPTAGLLVDGTAETTVELGAAAGDVVEIPVEVATGTSFGTLGLARLVVAVDASPVGVSSVRLPPSGGARGLVTVDGELADGLGLNYKDAFAVTANGTIAGESYHDAILQGPSAIPGFYNTGVFAVDPGSIDASRVDIEQEAPGALWFFDISGDGRRVLVSGEILDAGTPGRESLLVHDRDTGDAFEIGDDTIRPDLRSGLSGAPVISSSGTSVAFGERLSSTQVRVWWWRGDNFTDRRDVATVTLANYSRVSLVGVTDTRIAYRHWSTAKKAWVVTIRDLAGATRTILADDFTAPVMHPDGSAIAVTNLWTNKVTCYRVASNSYRTFDGGSNVTALLGVGPDCSYVVASFDLGGNKGGANGSRLYRIGSTGTKTLLATSRDWFHRWVSSPDGVHLATSTTEALVPGDTNGMYDVYRGAWSAPGPSGPVPSVAGEPKVGATLAATTAGWEPAFTSLRYQWSRNGVAIARATDSTYKLTAADAGRGISVTVTGTSRGVSASRTSARVTIQKVLTPAPVPKVSGVAEVGRTLTVVPGTWGPSPVTRSYQWLRNGTPIPLATGSTYVITAEDEGAQLTVAVTGSRSGYTPATRTSAAVTVKRVLTVTPTPVISGLGRSGTTLTIDASGWEPAPVTLSYQWRRNGVAIPKATASSYKLTSADAGRTVTVSVTGSRSGYATVSRTSAALPIERLFSTAPVPTIAGSAHAGNTLTARAGTWAPVAGIAFAWSRNGTPIPGAEGSTYVLTSDDAGQRITVSVTGTRPDHTPTTRTSAPTTVARLLTSTPVPDVAGTPSVGSTLTAAPGAWSPSGVAFTYQWKRDGVAISKATTTTYRVTAADLDRVITVTVRGTRSGYTPVSVTSVPVTVLRPFSAAPVPLLSGTAAVGETLAADPGTWSPSPEFTYRWYRDTATIPGAESPTYVVQPEDVGHGVSVRVTATLTGYLATTRSSAARSVVPAP